MRFANPIILQMAEDAKTGSQKAWDRRQSDIDARETPAVKFNPDNLLDTFELPKATPVQQNERDSYLLNNPGSGVAANPLLPVGQFIKQAVEGMPTQPGTLYSGPDPFQENNKIRPSDSDDQYMDVMRTGFV